VQSQAAGELFARATALAPVATALDAATDLASDVYLVGGTVRDLILRRQPLDIDLAVKGDALALATRIGTPGGAETRFGTVTASRDGFRYDLVRTRSERYSQPGALPTVSPAGIEPDLLRRDFTVNALALGLTGSRAGRLLAADGALDDLAAGRLAVLHDDSFRDDPTRLLRLARYAARLGFTIASRTRALAADAIKSGALQTVSGTRLGNELRLLASEPDVIAAFQATAELGLPWTVDPELAGRALAVLPSDGRPDLVAFAAVFARSELRTPQLSAELDRLGFTAANRERILEAVFEATRLAERLRQATTRVAVAHAVGTAGIETVALASAQGAPDQSLLWLRELRHLRLQITGAELIEHGIPEGPQIGIALQAATDALLDGQATDRDSQLAIALKAAQ
jgi:tRNA nucleotidyltransferase (CCA-adding enzyme)